VLGVKVYEAKIRDTNAPSIALFRKLGYREVRRVPVFQEVVFEYAVGGCATATHAAERT